MSTPKSNSTHNKFFNDNAIKGLPITRITSYSSNNLQPQAQAQGQTLNAYNSVRSFSQTQAQFLSKDSNEKEYQSMAATARGARLNPKQFTHREVFNNKLYQAETKGGTGMKKYFKIELNRLEKEQANLGTDYGQFVGEITRVFNGNGFHQNQELKKIWKNILHHIHLLQKTTNIPSSQPLKLCLQNTLTSLQSFLLILSSQLSSLQLYKREQQQNLLNLKRKKQLLSEQQLKKFQLQSTNKLETQLAQANAITKYRQKINQMDFQLKKCILRIERLEEELGGSKVEVSRLTEENQRMKREREDIQKWKEDYEYKIKKLKEELEVAHIVKQQNLQDKFNYILGWKL